jgi:ABC-type antimicrobial peptide transport system permease subunit
MARTLWPRESALGKCLYVGGLTQCATVVGIVRDAHRFGIREEPAMQYYVPLGQEIGMSGITLVVRPRGGVAPALELVRRMVSGMVPSARYVDVAALQDRVDSQIRPWRLGAAMFGVFAALALVVAAAGLYGVVGYAVAQRTREFGVRVAVGATTRDIIRLVLGYGMRVVVAGTVLAAGIGLLFAGKIGPQLFDESPRDPTVYVAVALVMIIVAGAALLTPAVRASSVDPAVALRQE